LLLLVRAVLHQRGTDQPDADEEGIQIGGLEAGQLVGDDLGLFRCGPHAAERHRPPRDGDPCLGENGQEGAAG
jgi:hypothetical protein